MKQYYIFSICLLVLLMFTSCGEDDIVALSGEWKLISYHSENKSNGSYDGQEYDYESKAVGKNFDYVLNFNDGNFSGLGFFELDVMDSGAWTIQLDSATAAQIEEEFGPFEPITEFSSNGTYEIKDEKLIASEDIIFGPPSIPEFIVSTSIEYDYDFNGDNLTIIRHNESSGINRDGILASSFYRQTTIWTKQ